MNEHLQANGTRHKSAEFGNLCLLEEVAICFTCGVCLVAEIKLFREQMSEQVPPGHQSFYDLCTTCVVSVISHRSLF